MNVHIQDRGWPTIGWRASFSVLQADSGAPSREAWPSTPVDALAPTPKEPVTPTPVPRSSGEWISPTASGSRADCAGDLAPGPEPREGRGQVQHDAAGRALHPHGELDQPLPQRGDLRVRAGGAARAALELLEQDVRGQRQQHAELVGQKPRATGPVHLQPVMQLLEAVLHVPALAVELVERPRRAGQVGHHEAGIVFGIAARMPADLGLHDDPPLAGPLLGGGARLAVEMLGAARPLGAHPRPAPQPPEALLQPRVAGHPPNRRRPRRTAPEKALRSWRISRRRSPMAPSLAGALPGRNTAATAYCLGSSLNV